MPRYVDGFVLPMPKKNIRSYLGMARLGAKVWLDHGALEYRECVGDDLNVKMGRSFPRRDQSEARRNRRLFLDRVQVTRAP